MKKDSSHQRRDHGFRHPSTQLSNSWPVDTCHPQEPPGTGMVTLSSSGLSSLPRELGLMTLTRLCVVPAVRTYNRPYRAHTS